jgi:hypothetical protein
MSDQTCVDIDKWRSINDPDFHRQVIEQAIITGNAMVQVLLSQDAVVIEGRVISAQELMGMPRPPPPRVRQFPEPHLYDRLAQQMREEDHERSV